MMRSLIKAIIATAALFAAVAIASARTINVPADGTQSLQQVLDSAHPGDVIRLRAGQHNGPIVIASTLTLEGEPGAVLAGNGQGSVLTVTGAHAVVRGLEIRGSGASIDDFDSGIYLDRSAVGAEVKDNHLIGNLYGVYIRGAIDALVENNRIEGRDEGRIAQTGNGVHLWNAPRAKVIGNEISKGRDGIFTNASRNNVFSRNSFSDLRFAIHYMYTNDSEVSGNISRGNSVGFAIMYSDRLTISGNISDGDRDHGLLLNTAKGSRVTENIVRGSMQPISRWLNAGRRDTEHGLLAENPQHTAAAGAMRLGPEKCVFIYNANRNDFFGNWFENCAIGIHFTAGSEGNRMSGNAFVGNRNQVKYVGTRFLDWSVDGRGNYWSDNPAFDLDADGIADAPYRPNDLADRVLWTAPQAKILVNSPAVQVLRWVQNQFPAILPGGVTDSRPLMTPPAPGGRT